MNSKLTCIILILAIFIFDGINAQTRAENFIVQGVVTSNTDGEPLIGVNVSEVDVNNRVVNGTVTDFNGRYVMKLKDPNNRLVISYVGFNRQIQNIQGKKTLNIVLVENVQSIKAVEIVATRRMSQGGFNIPTREISTAMQTLDTKELEGLQVASIDDALQGRIAGLDIVATSGDPGSGTSMRIRGVTSITGSSEPLIVVNGVPFETQIDPLLDFASANAEQFAKMLNINPDDIQEITVLKDAAASAIWGSKGANGVLMITTKKGASGPTRVDYTYRYTGTVQPRGLNMLSGSDFTMLMKQSYFNVAQNENANNINEYNYDRNFPDYENFNNNTDWVKEVTQIGNIQDHYLTLSGGGERANFRVSAGNYSQRGTVIGQQLNRFSSRANLEYSVSDRIRFITEFSLTNTVNNRNYENMLGIAYRKMPNVSVYAQDAQGNNTSAYYNISRNSLLHADQRNLRNPVALANLATNRLHTLRILPTFRLQYDLLNPEKQMLRYQMYVSFDINNNNTTRFLPQEVSNLYWNNESVNRAETNDSESVVIYSDQNIAWQPKFKNKDHSLLLYGSFQINVGNSSGQNVSSYSVPTTAAIDATAEAYLLGSGTAYSSWRSMAVMGRAHYSYKGRYVASATLRRDGSTKFGDGNKFGNFPGISLKWIISDEPFMEKQKDWLSLLAIRPAWGISGNQPGEEYLHFSRYVTYGTYIDMSAIRPDSPRLRSLKWETTSSFNYGIDIGFFDDKYIFDLNFYNKRTVDLLFRNVAISTSSGYGNLSYINGGTMDNDGWELNFFANRFIKTKDFSMDFRFNLSNYKNTLIDLNQSILDSYNQDFNYSNGSYLTRVQKGNSFGSIYGFRYKGVYQWDEYSEEHVNAPVAKDAGGNVITDQDGNPKSMYFNYYGKGGGNPYKFRGGDVIYEDINHDGSIDELDIVYLGNANPKVNGGFGPTFRYKTLSLNMFFNFRIGNKIVNQARMNAENMYYDNNQSIAVNWRWRKDGDITEMPRALHLYGYNWLGSDRYVEDGSFLRMKYLTFNYSVPSDIIRKFKLNRLNFYLTFNNIFVLTRYTGVDPEVGYGSLGLSRDNNQTPRSKDMTLGVSVGF